MADKRTSPIWQYFSDAGENKKKCTLCGNLLSVKGGGLFNLTRHLKSKHLLVATSIRESAPPPLLPIIGEGVETNSRPDPASSTPTQMESIESSVPHEIIPSSSSANLVQPPVSRRPTQYGSSVRPYLQRPMSIKHIDDLNKDLVEMVTKNYFPFSVVENESFKKFINKLNPAYPIPTRKTLSNALLEKHYNIKCEEIKEKLKTVKYVAITTDCWTSIVQESYISITVHYVDQNTTLQAHMLQCFSYNDRHTSENLAKEIKISCEKWEIQEKVQAVTTDNAASAQGAVALTGWKQVPCFAHTINLSVQASLLEIKGTRDRIKTIVDLFRRSPLAAERLKAMQIRLGEKVLKVKQDVVTRWNSTYDMFQRVLEIKTSLISTLANDYPRVQNLDNEDIPIIIKACEVLKIFKSVTEIMSSEKSVTISEIITLSHLLMNKTKTIVETHELPVPVHNMALKLCDQLQDRFKRVEDNSLFSISTLLDPRFKKYGFPESRQTSYIKAKGLLYDLAARVVLASETPESLEATTAVSSSSFQNAAAVDINASIWAEFDTRVTECMRNTNPRAASIVEVDKYLEEPLLERQRDPFRWWEDKKFAYPRLYQIMLKRFCIPASSVPSERVFSKAGHMISDRRSRLMGLKVDKLLFLNFNM